MHLRRRLAPALLIRTACQRAAPQGPAMQSPNPGYTSGVVTTEVVARGLEHPWGLAILLYVITDEKDGQLLRVVPVRR